MRRLVFLIAFSCLTFQSFAQVRESEIQMHKTFWGVRFQQGNKILPPKALFTIIASDPQAEAEIKKAKVNYVASSVLGFTGGFLIGWPLGTALAGGEPEWGLAAGGFGIILLAIPFNAGFTSHAKNAIEIYNHGSEVSSARPYSIQLAPYRAGIKLIFKF